MHTYSEVHQEKPMTEHKARRLAFAAASLIVSLILLCVILNLVYPAEGLYGKAFWICLGLLFLFIRAVPKKLWVPG